MGRYLYHMPTTYTDTQVRTAGPDMLASLRSDLQQGSDVLRGSMERDARGELRGRDGRRVKYGSYHIVGSRVSRVACCRPRWSTLLRAGIEEGLITSCCVRRESDSGKGYTPARSACITARISYIHSNPCRPIDMASSVLARGYKRRILSPGFGRNAMIGARTSHTHPADR